MNSYGSDSEKLPPLPPPGSPESEICAVIQTYMAVESDLSPVQLRAVAAHVRMCADCAHEQQVLRGLTRLVTRLPETEPSQRVDDAVFAAIAARRSLSQNTASSQTTARLRPVPGLGRRPPRKKPVSIARRTSLIAAAAALVLALLTSLSFIFGYGPFGHSFSVPGSVTWSGNVMYYTQTATEKDGTTYQVTGYYNLDKNVLNVRYTIPGKMDVMIVSNQQGNIAIDNMHQQWQSNVDLPTEFDGDLFNAQQVRQDLQSGKAKYNGTESFAGQSVYSITCPDSQILLLNTASYTPVNVLDKSGKPEYDTVRFLSPSQVPASTWSMDPPSGYQVVNQMAMPE